MYKEREIAELLHKHFPNLSEKQLIEEISQVGEVHYFKAGDVIMEEGTYVKMVPLVIEGSIKVVRVDEGGNEMFLYYITGGESCTMSFSCCMMRKKSEIRTVADEDVALIGIPLKYMDLWMTRFQSWKNFVMTSYDKRMFELIKTIDSVAFTRMDERLLKYLHNKVKMTGSRLITITHQSIAYDLNASREAVSRLLKQLERDGVVKLGRNKIELV